MFPFYYRCDADSSALARYVLALLKKDKPEKELKKLMIEQLDVFLGEETRPFVERLFSAINSEDYFTDILLPTPKLSGDNFVGEEVVSDMMDTRNVCIEGPNNTEPQLKIDNLPNTVCAENVQTPPLDDVSSKFATIICILS